MDEYVPSCIFRLYFPSCNFQFCVDNIFKIVTLLDQNEAHAQDEISVHRIKRCASTISKPLHLIFRNCVESESCSKV